MLEHLHFYVLAGIAICATVAGYAIYEFTELKERLAKLFGRRAKAESPLGRLLRIQVGKGLLRQGDRISLNDSSVGVSPSAKDSPVPHEFDDESTITIRKEVTEIRVSRGHKGKG